MAKPVRTRSSWVIWMTLIIGIIFKLTPLATDLSFYRPLWVAMIVYYWIMIFPQRFALFFAFIVGLIEDAILGNLIGIHTLALITSAAIVSAIQNWLIYFPKWQQAIIFFFIFSIYTTIVLILRLITNHESFSILYFIAPAVSALLWPLLFIMLDKIRHTFNVH